FCLPYTHDLFEHERRIGQQRPSRVGDDFEIGQHIRRDDSAQAPYEIERVCCAYRIAMHDPQRVTALHDVDPGQGPPCSSHRVKCAATASFELGEIGKIV